jgi:hypothetical protein
MHIRDIISTNSSLFLSNCLQKLCDDMNILQQNIDFKYHGSNYFRENLIRTCRDHSAFIVELHNSSVNSSFLVDFLCINIVNWKTTNKSTNHTYLQNIDDSSHDQCFTNRQYRREFFNNNNRDNDRFSFNFRFRDKFSIRVSKICFVCDKSACWSTNDIEKEREKSKKRFINRNSTYKTRSEFERRFEQFIVDYEDNDDINKFIAQYFAELIIDDVSQKKIRIDEFVIEINNEFETFLIFVESINDIETFTIIINMFADKTFKHKLISKNNTIVFIVSISYIYIVFIASRYDNRELKNILIDHDATDFFSDNIEQFTILQRISKSSLSLNKNKIISFKFDINEIFFIDTINLNTSIDVITFNIVFVHTSFLLCLVDMNCLRFYFNNLINMLIKNQSSIKVLFEKEFYFIHSNQIKRFQIQILMSSKSLIRNDKTILDLHIDLKAFQMINDLQISLKIKHFRKVDNLHINMKNEHYSMIRQYDHAFLL